MVYLLFKWVDYSNREKIMSGIVVDEAVILNNLSLTWQTKPLTWLTVQAGAATAQGTGCTTRTAE